MSKAHEYILTYLDDMLSGNHWSRFSVRAYELRDGVLWLKVEAGKEDLLSLALVEALHLSEDKENER